MHQNDCEHTHTHTLTKAQKHTYLSSRISCEGGVLRQVKVRSNRALACAASNLIVCTVFTFMRVGLHAALNLLCVRVCALVCDTCVSTGVPSMPTVTADPAWQQAGAGGRGVPLRDSITALFVKQSWQPGEQGGERTSKAQGFKGRGVKISTEEIQEVVISTKQTGSQGRGSGHNMGGCSISSELCSLDHCEAWAAVYMRSSMYGHQMWRRAAFESEHRASHKTGNMKEFLKQEWGTLKSREFKLVFIYFKWEQYRMSCESEGGKTSESVEERKN